MDVRIRFINGDAEEVFSPETEAPGAVVRYEGGFVVVEWLECDDGKPPVKCSTAYPAHRVRDVETNGRD